ncbi:ORF6N domain-containing protein [bacterium]|nr:ORF6N domain-containing protein [bacterium]
MGNEIALQRIDIENKILVIRGEQVIIDRDLAKFYGVATKVLNQAVKRNIERFPEEFCFQLNKEEFENWKSQFVTSNSDKMDRYKIEDRQGIFFQGQIFDAYAKFESFIQSSEKEIILIDNYVDLSVLERFSKKRKNVKVTIYTDPKTKLSAHDADKFNEQYPQLILKYTAKVHDRFLIIDNAMLYHIGASLKDLGKKCFAFEVLDPSWIKEILKNL